MSVDPLVELHLATAADVVVRTARWYSQAARELQAAEGRHYTLQRIVELASRVVGADLAALIGRPRSAGPPPLLAATDYRAAEELVALQAAAGAAPAWHSMLQRGTVHVGDLAVDDRWRPDGEQLVTARPFRTVLAFCLLVDDQPLASLALYSRRPAGFSPDQVEVAAAFADHAAIAFNQSAQAEKITNLETALAHARDIGAAVGIIMADRKITQDQAFDQLRQASQNRNRRLYDLALEIVQTGEISCLT